ncbi:PREDICTED: RNA polymerase II subunit A C-terminal domain phosphatase SSU72 [Mandrillus leucophaeus]|uniref:RNA polymerase II subunit A C-terminal domain phosphatase SSU72 n=1 Tax=Mandrillus leucophaeus TaxID=9568 RepID=UPI0005F4DDAA|nr:PREDICTED: RNA polymerase II subunit A C-terminal domain phosphatase SSU72 [Mandrillus leucophaeus]
MVWPRAVAELHDTKRSRPQPVSFGSEKPQASKGVGPAGSHDMAGLAQRPGKRGFSVRSFGTGTHVKLPGPAPDKPNVYDFKTTYDQMYNDLLRKDKELYTQNGILHMLDRNKRIKPRPERFQNCKDLFDLILTCEERVYDQVVEGEEVAIQHTEDMENEIDELLQEFEEKSGRTFLHTVCFY